MATTASATTTAAPSAAALTTVFTPATTCSGLTFSAPDYSIWYNEPVPAPTITESGCYPSQWLNGYTALSTSSVAPALSPLVCPLGWSTALKSTSNYIACCPTGYNVHPPASTVDKQRPVYGGLCFSEFLADVSLTVVEYNKTGIVQTQTVPFSTSGQVYAHIIDGYVSKDALTTTSAAPNASGLSMSTASSIATSSPSVSHKHLSGGAIAGIVIGCVVGVLAVLALGFFVLRRRKQQQKSKQLPDKVDGEVLEANDGQLIRNESDGTPIFETDATPVTEKDGFPKVASTEDSAKSPAELAAGRDAAHEMESPPILPEPAELESAFDPNWHRGTQEPR
ncbi:hypothetical protein AAFC00_005573 [Neodothiora populina]|uniref:Uncharacterized protein n=1 Tax=Neodothiora populina TaxID=2781224 RepID=A0ABR3PLA9_9PEZI